MNIEAGKFYRTRGGWKVGPAEYLPRADDLGRCWLVDGCVYHPDGSFMDRTRETPNDLVAEWSDAAAVEPVRELAAGIYGRIAVMQPRKPGHATVGWSGAPISCMVDMNADDLRDVSHVLLQIAEFLENSG